MSLRHVTGFVLFTVLFAASSFGAAPAERNRNAADEQTAVGPAAAPAPSAIVSTPVPATSAAQPGDFTADFLMHLDPWSALAANSSYKNCVTETNQVTCYARCTCGYNENVKKCDGGRACIDLAGTEKEACDTHCLTDY